MESLPLPALMLGKPKATVSIRVYTCSDVPGFAMRGWYMLQFHQLLDFSEFVRFVVEAKAQICLWQARLAQRLAELFAIQYTYARITGSPAIDEQWNMRFRFASVQTATGLAVEGMCRISGRVDPYLQTCDQMMEPASGARPVIQTAHQNMPRTRRVSRRNVDK